MGKRKITLKLGIQFGCCCCFAVSLCVLCAENFWLSNFATQAKTTTMSAQDLPNYNIDTFHYLRAAAPGLFTYCAKENKEFYACKKQKGENPEACLGEAIEVRRCAFRLYVEQKKIMNIYTHFAEPNYTTTHQTHVKRYLNHTYSVCTTTRENIPNATIPEFLLKLAQQRDWTWNLRIPLDHLQTLAI